MTVAPDTMALELPLAPRSFWDVITVLTPVIQYYVALVVLFLGARYLNRQLNNETDAQERETRRPVLARELILESSEDEAQDDDEAMDELMTDSGRLVAVKTTASSKKRTSHTPKELFAGLQQIEHELRDKKAKEDTDDRVSWNELHSRMLRRYQDKYPGHGPRVAQAETDTSTDDFHKLLRKHNIDPNELKSFHVTAATE